MPKSEAPATVSLDRKVDGLVVLDTVVMGVSVALMTVVPIRTGGMNRQALSRYSAFCAFTLSFVAFLLSQCSDNLKVKASKGGNDIGAGSTEIWYIVVLSLSVIAAIAMFVAMLFLL
ncbi:hypothetical protein FRC03_001430 [Tulasnella sp. 419]|nr:hypothetical protein FRC03_001430 [Tulasnella sp. 419]